MCADLLQGRVGDAVAAQLQAVQIGVQGGEEGAVGRGGVGGEGGQGVHHVSYLAFLQSGLGHVLLDEVPHLCTVEPDLGARLLDLPGEDMSRIEGLLSKSNISCKKGDTEKQLVKSESWQDAENISAQHPSVPSW